MSQQKFAVIDETINQQIRFDSAADKSQVDEICVIIRQSVNKFRRMGSPREMIQVRDRDRTYNTLSTQRSSLKINLAREICQWYARDLSCSISIISLKSEVMAFAHFVFPYRDCPPFPYFTIIFEYKSPHRLSHPSSTSSSCQASPTSLTHVSRATESGTLDKFPLYLLHVLIVAHYPGWGMREECR